MPAGVLENDKGISARGIVPWHRSPQWKVYEEAGITIPQVVADCFDWTVDIEQARRFNRDNESVIVPDTFYVVRQDTDHVLATVGNKYTPVQNAEAAEMFANVVDDGDILIDTAGSLWNGRKIFISAQFPEAKMTVGGESQEDIECYILLSNSHDGTGSLEFSIVPVRVVCQNTLSWALAEATRTFKVRHTTTVHARAMGARDALDLAFKATQDLHDELEQFANFTITDSDLEKLLDVTIPLVTPKGEELTKLSKVRAENKRDAVTAIYRGQGYGQAGIKDTAYGALMAFSAFADHEATFKNTDASTAEENAYKTLISGKAPIIGEAHKAIKALVTA